MSRDKNQQNSWASERSTFDVIVRIQNATGNPLLTSGFLMMLDHSGGRLREPINAKSEAFFRGVALSHRGESTRFLLSEAPEYRLVYPQQTYELSEQPILLVATDLHEQVLAGYVLDSSQRPLERVRISLMELGAPVTYSNVEGFFSLRVMGTRFQLVRYRATLEGYKTWVSRTELGTDNLQFELTLEE